MQSFQKDTFKISQFKKHIDELTKNFVGYIDNFIISAFWGPGNWEHNDGVIADWDFNNYNNDCFITNEIDLCTNRPIDNQLVNSLSLFPLSGEDICCFYEENDADQDGICEINEVIGCTSQTACNYNENATDDDGLCIYED